MFVFVVCTVSLIETESYFPGKLTESLDDHMIQVLPHQVFIFSVIIIQESQKLDEDSVKTEAADSPPCK